MILPRSQSNPVGGVRQIQRARGAWRRHLASVRKWLLEEVSRIPVETLTINTVYEYQIDVARLRQIIDELSVRVGDPQPQELIVNEVSRAYEMGTAAAVTNLSALTDDYTRTVTQVIASQPWQRRVALIQSRVFEEMQGFAGDAARDLGRVLSQGIENGQNPRVVAKVLRERFSVSQSRANRIARTEITGALRRGRLDEAQEAEERLGIKTKMLWISALAPTSRPHHVARSGNLYDAQEVRDFYAVDGNGINCLCTQVQTLVDDDGNPITGKSAIERVRSAKAKYRESETGNS